jgi:hypothetical protein
VDGDCDSLEALGPAPVCFTHYVCICVCTYINICMCACVCMYTYKRVHINMYIYVHKVRSFEQRQKHPSTP